MKPVDSTAEILIWKHFNKSVDEKWSFWAVDMMMAGFDTEHIVELAGISKPYNQFELGALTDRVFNELRIDFSDQQSLVIKYTTFLAKEVLMGRRDLLNSLRSLNQLFNKTEFDQIIQDFYLLYFAKEDLISSEIQWYWEGANRDNIDTICMEQFEKWLEKYGEE
tara:strand:+ start:128249 stop:128743 length:495 start_codon:yes stop_codon:yes gene_type:complete